MRRLTDLNYSFDDEPVFKFFYDRTGKEIIVTFHGCYDTDKQQSMDGECRLIVRNWEEAQSKGFSTDGETDYGDLETYLGVFDGLLDFGRNGEWVTLFVENIDSRFTELLFKNAEISVCLEPEETGCRDNNRNEVLDMRACNISVDAFLYADDIRRMEFSYGRLQRGNERRYAREKRVLVIENWKEIKSRPHDEGAKAGSYKYHWERYIGIISRILDIRKEDDELYVVAETIDSRCIDLLFKSADIYYI